MQQKQRTRIAKCQKEKKRKKKKEAFNVQGNDFFPLSLKHYLLDLKNLCLKTLEKGAKHYNLVL